MQMGLARDEKYAKYFKGFKKEDVFYQMESS